MNIVTLFLDAAKRFPNSKAIVQGDQWISFEELCDEVKRTAGYFKSKGVGQGDNVLVFVPMSIDLYRVLLSLFYIGARAVFVDEWASGKRLNSCCKTVACTAMIGVPKARWLNIISSEIRKIPIWLTLKKRGEMVQAVSLTNEETALITFTTGSSGLAKAARRTHGFLKHQFDALQDEISPKAKEIELTTLPIILFNSLGTGCTSILPAFKTGNSQEFNPEILFQQVDLHKVSRVITSPYFIINLAEYILDKAHFLPNLKEIFTGGAPVFPQEAKVLVEAFPEADIQIVYGSTEAEPIASISAAELANYQPIEGLPVGSLFHAIQCLIIPITHQPIQLEEQEPLRNRALPEGKPGEIVVSGMHVLEDYYRSEEAWNRNKIVENERIWHRTGDSGYVKDGILYLTGSCSQVIIHGDRFISPFMIENTLRNRDGITSGTLIEQGELLWLVLETNVKDISKLFIPEGIPYDKIKTLKRIPRDPRHHSKIDYNQLRKLLK